MSYRLWTLVVAALLLAGVAWTAGEAVAGLSAYYALDEGTGSTAYDGTPNSNDGTISGATWTTGHSGSALYFHGGGQWFDGDCVTVPHSASLDITGPFEVEAWIKATGSDSYNAIVDKYSYSGGFGYGFTLYLNNGRLRLSVYSGPQGGGNVIGTTDLRDNAWHRVAGVWDGSRVIVYVGGTPEAENLWSHAPASTSNNLGIGKRLGGHGGYLPFLGTIDEVYISAYQDQPPMCGITWDPPAPVVFQPVTFDAHASDPDGGTVTCSWDFGDGHTASGCVASHTYTSAGSYVVTVTVTDDEGGTVTCTETVNVDPPGPPVPELLEPIDSAWAERRPPLYGVVTLYCTEASGRTSVTDPSGNGDIASVAFDYSPDGGMTWLPIDLDYDGMIETEGTEEPSEPHYDWWSVEWDLTAVPFPEGLYTIQATMEDDHGQTGQSSTNVAVTTSAIAITAPLDYQKFGEGSIITLTTSSTSWSADWYWQPKQKVYTKGVPMLSQLNFGYTNCPQHGLTCPNNGNYFCAPVAMASCLKWWAANGFPALTAGLTDQQLVEGLALAMTTQCNSGTSPPNQVAGARNWIAARGVAGLHVTGPLATFKCTHYRNELENCKEDVLFAYVKQAISGGWVRHRVTGNSFDNAFVDNMHWIDYIDPGGGQIPAYMRPDGWIQPWLAGPFLQTADMITVSPDIPLQPWYLACAATTTPQTWDLSDSTTWKDANTPMQAGYYLLRADTTVGIPPFQGVVSDTIVIEIADAGPWCNITWSPQNPLTWFPVTFRSNAAEPGNPGIGFTCNWTFGDGNTGSGCVTSNIYTSPGTYTVYCTVTDDEGTTGGCQAQITVTQPTLPVPDLLEPIDPGWADRRPPLHGLVTLHCTEANGRTSVTDPSGTGDIVSVVFEYSPDGGGIWEPIGEDYDGTTPTDGGLDVSGVHYDWWSVDWDVSEVPYPPGEFTLRVTMEDTHGQSGQSTVHAWAYPAIGPQRIAQPTEYATFPEGSTIPLALGGAALVADWHWQPKQDIYLKGVPTLSQYQLSGWPQSGYDIGDPAHPNGCPGDYFCAPVAWASCFLWWDAQPGYGALVPTEMEVGQTPGPKKLVEELAKLMGTKCDSGTAWQDQLTGARQWIAARGVALHVSYYSEYTLDGNQWWCKIYRNELENCKEDVLLSYITTQGGRHRVVGNGFDNATTTDYACVLQVMCPGYGSYRDAMMKPDDVPEGGVISFDSGQNWTPTKDIMTASPDVPLQPWYLACPSTIPVPQSWNLNNSTTWQNPNTPMKGDSYYLLRADSTVVVGPNQTRLYADTIVIEITNTTPTCDILFSPRDASDGKVWVRSPVTFISQAWDAGNPGQVGLTCQWDFGDGNTGSGCTTGHLYWNPGTYQVTLTVTDDEGYQCTDVQNVTAKVFQFPTHIPVGGGWNIITLPCIHSDPWEVFDELRPPNKQVDLLSGNLHRYDHEGLQYVTYYEWAPSDFGALRAGDAYWLYSFEEEIIEYEGDWSGAEEQVEFTTPGWYMMGSPQPFDTHLESTMWWQGPMGPMPFSGIMDLWVQDPLIGYSSLEGRYVSVGLKGTDEDEYLRAFQGYWIYAVEPDLSIVVPPPP